MDRFLRLAFFGFVVLAGAALPVQAQMFTLVRPADAVTGAAGVTFADLIREIVPDLKEEGGRYSGTEVIDVKHVEDDYDMEPPVEPTLDNAIMDLPLGGKRRLLLVDLGPADGDAGNFVVLALFDTAKSPRLVDAINVGLDRLTSFLVPPVRSVGAGQLVSTSSVHANSNQTYTATALVLLRGDLLETVDAIYTFGDATCAVERPQQLTIATDRSDTAFFEIVARVTEYFMPTGDDCGDETPPQAGSRTVTVVYRWDEAQAKYIPDSDAFEKLAEENAERF